MLSGKAGGGLGLGPVFTYEWLTSSRRWQVYAIRALFVSSLLAALVAVWLSDRSRHGAGSSVISSMAQLGESFFLGVVGTQLTLVLLVAPAATAGAICLDRTRGTLTHMLVTDLSDREIVLGKLAARLVPVLGLVVGTLPMMALLTLLGGVDPDALLGAFAVTLGVVLLGCSLALVCSLWAGKTHEALLGTYAVWGLWLLGRPMLDELRRLVGWSVPLPPRSADPFWLAFAPYWSPRSVTGSDYAWFLIVTCALSALLVTLAVSRIRSICVRAVVRSRLSRFIAFRMISRLNPARLLPGPSLDRNPVLWREWHRARPSRWARLVGALYGGLAVFFSTGVIFSTGTRDVAAWVNGLQVSVGLLLLSVTAATSLAEERVRGSLDVLMTTTLSTRQIVLGKWLGTYRVVPPMAILPALVVFSSGEGDAKLWPGVVLMLAYVLSAGAAVTSLGLAMATRYSRLGRAVGTTVALYVLITVGWLFVSMFVFSPGELGPAMGSPFFFAGIMTIEQSNSVVFSDVFGWGTFWVIVSTSAAAALLTITLIIFDRCLGRADDTISRLVFAPQSRLARKTAAIFFGLAMVLTVAVIATEADRGLGCTAVVLMIATVLTVHLVPAPPARVASRLGRPEPMASKLP